MDFFNNNKFFDTMKRDGKIPPVEVIITIPTGTLVKFYFGLLITLIIVILLTQIFKKL